MIKFLLELFVLYIIYKFVFELVMPIYQASKLIKKKMDQANQQMRQNQTNGFTKSDPSSSTSSRPSTNADGDYIDFEEIK